MLCVGAACALPTAPAAVALARGRVPCVSLGVLCSAISHPHIVQPKSLIRTHTCLCVLADHANGGDVFQMVLRGGRGLSPPAARFLFQQLVLTTMFAHLFAMFLVDIKPSRLLVFWNQHNMPILKISFISLSMHHLQRTSHEVPPPDSPVPNRRAPARWLMHPSTPRAAQCMLTGPVLPSAGVLHGPCARGHALRMLPEAGGPHACIAQPPPACVAACRRGPGRWWPRWRQC